MIKKFDVGERQIYFKKYDKFKDILERNLNIPYKKVKKGLGIAIVSSLLTIQGCYVLNGFFERCLEKKINLEKRVEQTKLNNEPKLKSIKKIKPSKSGEKFALPEHVEKSIDYWASMYSNDKLMSESIAFWESGGDIYKVSNEGAAGVMQIMPATARQVGLDVPYYSKKGDYNCKYSFTKCDITNDQRFNLDYNIRAGMKYQGFLKKLPWINNNNEKMLAAYHAGPYKVKEVCGDLNYEECKSQLPLETKKYVKGVMYIYNHKRNKN